jgi:hypothetical protein
MSLEIEQDRSIDDELEIAREFKCILDSISKDEKQSIITYRLVEGGLPIDKDSGNLYDSAEVESVLRAICRFGIGYVNEEEFMDHLKDLQDAIGPELQEPSTWDFLTRLEIAENEDYDKHHIEAYIYKNGKKINGIGVDLIGESESIELITCKFSISTQHKEACRRLSELHDIKTEIDCIIGLGTLSVKNGERIISDISQHTGDLDELLIDKLVTADDIFDYT